MRKHLAIVAVVFCNFVSYSVAAEDSSVDLASRFVTLMRYSDQYSEYHRQCIAAGKSVAPESLVKENPNYFAGIRPGDKRWPDVVKAYSLYYEESCQRPTEKEFLSAMASAYATQLSPAELEDAIVFYSSKLGQRLIVAHKVAARNVYEEWHRLNSEQVPLAVRNLNDRVTELSNKGSDR